MKCSGELASCDEFAGEYRMSLIATSPVLLAPGILSPRKDHRQGGAPAAKRGRTTLTVIFARRQDSRREEDGLVRLHRRGYPAVLRPEPPACGRGPADRRAAPRP